MKTYLVTYYFVDGSVYAVRYENQENFYGTIETLLKVERCLLSNGHEIVNINNVLRFTIDELEGDEQ